MPYKEESQKARMCAVRYLAYRDRSRNEIAHYLKGKGFSTSALDETLALLEDNNYINDPRFALKFGRSRIENKKVGKIRLERELKDKGLESQIISKALNSLYEEYDEREIAIVCAKKKLESFSLNDIEKERGRLARFLERKGFSSSLVYQVVTQLIPRASNNDLVPSLPLTGKQYQKTVSSRSQD